MSDACCDAEGHCHGLTSTMENSEDHRHAIEATGQTSPSRSQEDDSKCCEDNECKCDDGCLEELARAMCADDAAHLHDHKERDVDKDSLSACSTCVGDESCADVDATAVAPPTRPCTHIGLRKRKSPRDDANPEAAPFPPEACGQHRSFARNRYQQTLAAFGCVCKAMLSFGLQSCCTTMNATKGRATARSIRASTSRRSLIPSTKSQLSVDSCCKGGGCCDGGSAATSHCHDHASVVRSVRRSVDSCRSGAKDSCCGGCQDSCCGGGSDAHSHTSVKDGCCSDGCNEKSGAYGIGDELGTLEKGISVSNERAVLAVRGMTCSGCENKLIRVLRALPTVRNVKTSLVLCRAEFDFDDGATSLQTLVQTIEQRTGFSVETINAGKTCTLMLRVERGKCDGFLSIPPPKGVDKVARLDKDTMVVSYDPRIIGARQVILDYAAFSPSLAPEPRDPAMMAGLRHIRTLTLRTVASAVLTIPVLVMAWAPLPSHPRAYNVASLVLATLVQTLITGPIYVSAFKSLFFARVVETDLLVVLSTSAAYVYSVVACAFEFAGRPLASGGFFETSTLLVTLIVLGQLVSAYARQRAMETISIRTMQQGLAKIVRSDGSEEDVDARLLQYGDVFKVDPDSMVITDGVVFAGQSEIDESMMTGESKPVAKAAGSTVIAGTVNGPSTLLVTVSRLPGENTISEIAEMVDDARFSRAKVQAIVDRVVGWFVPVIVAAAVVTFVVWLAVGRTTQKRTGGDAAASALTYAIAVLAVSCPCAIGLAVPMVILIAGGVAAKRGVVFKAATTIEIARKVTHAVFDKTGTLTQGKLSVVTSDAWPVEEFDVNAAILVLTKDSRHPVARAVSEYLKAHTDISTTVKLDHVELITGKGIQGTFSGSFLRGGNPLWLDVEEHPAVKPMLLQGLTAFCVTYNSRLVAVFGLEDALRPESLYVLDSLRKRNVRISILSGDHRAAVEKVATALAIPSENVAAGCMPADKQAYIASLASKGDCVLFCGDGTNDAVALARADIGVHLHTGEGAGFAASSAADVVLLHPSLTGILTLLQLSDAVARRIMLNFGWSAVYNLVAILFAAGAFVNARLPPAYAGLGEIVSVLPVVLVALQLRWFKPDAPI
ncbi:E1-E2 ATPase-domain-containing protein [Fomitopsis serialis]|uniref:E1-E2 ATPase-domain-containing protein n=1 Tax=Fomitopsis serialis TaxID=139415 RepID=UPI0020079F44|nr:E1-E2 ATPase-domain-containing protein [Neoantrodia serialis]KAH9933447.1 E1-E2 ATPase-domain-containing protein [Neoantrodia serialis]